MGVGSIVLGVVSLLMMFGGILLTWLPGVGSILSFGAPVVALVGAVLGGIAMSRAKQDGESGGAGTAGLIVSIIAFLFSLIFALTCGLCNALCTAGMIAGPRNRDGGAFSWTRGNRLDDLDEDDAGASDGALGVDPDVVSGSPPPAFPPPPIGSGAVQTVTPEAAPDAGDATSTSADSSSTDTSSGQPQTLKRRRVRPSPPPPPPG